METIIHYISLISNDTTSCGLPIEGILAKKRGAACIMCKASRKELYRLRKISKTHTFKLVSIVKDVIFVVSNEGRIYLVKRSFVPEITNEEKYKLTEKEIIWPRLNKIWAIDDIIKFDSEF